MVKFHISKKDDEDSIETDSKSNVDLEINVVESTEERKEKEKKMIDGIFAFQNRTFGTVAEMIIRKKYGLSKETKDQHHDATDSNGNRIEIKFSKGLKKNKKTLTEDNFLDDAIYSSMHHRALSHDNYHVEPFDLNIQQVKVSEFDEMYYGIFFIDKVAVFKVKSEDVKNIEGYSDFQQKGNKGEGQFHLNTNTIDYHMKNHFAEWIEYSEVYEMFSEEDA